MTDIDANLTESDPRYRQLQQWAGSVVENLPSQINGPAAAVWMNWQAVTGDASARRYFRASYCDQSYILMDAPPPQEALGPFIDIASRLLASGLHAPSIFAADSEAGFLLLEDLGQTLLQSLLAADRGQWLFDQVSPLLSVMAKKTSTDGLPRYSATRLQAELDLLPQWFGQQHLGRCFSPSEQVNWQLLCDQLIASAEAQPQVFVHRDFHSCNLHQLKNGSVGIIDFQDAVLGPLSYDLVSWLWDRYISWPRSALETWIEQARLVLAPDISAAQWLRYCDFMALQRNLKIIGIFARLHYRDNKSGYLAMTPRFIDYVLDLLPRYPELGPASDWLQPWLQTR
ncbi:MAG: phosphotransferase [Pseudomonadales bacterium]|nr:phosphotransferase [Pseudomonadales bacterium]